MGELAPDEENLYAQGAKEVEEMIKKMRPLKRKPLGRHTRPTIPAGKKGKQ